MSQELSESPESSHDVESFELANTRLKLRDGLRFVLQDDRSGATYVMRDPVTSKVHQFGLTQYAFVSGFDGSCSLGDLTQKLASAMPHAALSTGQAEQTARYLIDHQLAFAIDPSGHRIESTDRLIEGRSQLADQRRAENANPLFVKMPLADPEPLLDKLTPVFGWLFSPAGVIGILLLMLFAVLQLWQFQSEVALSVQGLLDPKAAVWLAIVFCGLKIVHELGHGIACHRFGGRVSETGLVFILFMPIPYVDVTSSWCFQSRRRRMLVSGAGMLVEMAVASIAAIAWTMTVDPVVRFHLMNVILMGTLTTLLFNANFLMRFDGYFLLSDAIGIPNLAPTSRGFVAAYAKRIFLGTPLALSQHDRSRSFTLFTYGVAAMIWRVVVCFGLALVASQLFYGFGIVLALASVVIWFGRPMGKFFLGLAADTVDAKKSRRYLLQRTLPAAIGVALLLCITPWPWQASAPAIVRHRDEQIVRCPASGFLHEILVDDGQHVDAGDLIAVLEDRRLVADVAMTKARLTASRLRMRRELSAGNIASHQAERALHASLENRFNELLQRQESLSVRAQVSGFVFAPDLSDQVGVHCAEGFELGRIVNPESKELLVSISQRDQRSFGERSGQAIRFLFGGTGQENVNLEQLNPHAKDTTDPRLTASGGGELAQQQFDNEMRLVEPRFEGVAVLSPEQSLRLFAGMKGTVRLTDHRQSVAGRLWECIPSW